MPLHHGLRAAAGASPADPYFSSTSLLLLGNGTNGGQNNTFVDGSTNNFTITRNGNTTQGSFSPFSAPDGRWSNYFDGATDVLGTSNSSAWAFGTGDLTIEFWFNVSAFTSGGMYYMSQNSGISPNWYIFSDSSTLFRFGRHGASQYHGFTTALSTGQWYHVAIVRSGTTMYMFLNGVSQSLTTSGGGVGSFDFSSSTELYIAGANPTAGNNYNGYFSNLRILKGTAQYTSNFTPSTSPLTAITNTSLLTCQSNRFIDNSSNAFTITPSGNAAVTSFSPFAPLAEYSASSNGGSGYFDGSGDKLTIPVNQAPLLLGSSDFSFECWIYWTQSISRAVFYIAQNDGATATGSSYMFSVANSSTTSDFWIGSSYYGVTCPIPNLNSWAHIAFSRTGGTLSSFLNGNRIGTRSDLGTGSINNGSTAYPQTIGTNSDGSSAFQGYISGMRLIKGSGGYDATQSTIAIPSAVPSAITNTSLLLNFTNASIIDSTAKNDLETVGDAQVSTSVKKFGTGSLKFDGTGDYCVVNGQTSDFAFGTGDFTIEFWLYLNSIADPQVIYDSRPISTQTTQATVYVLNGGSIRYYTNAINVITGSTLSTSTWYHIAVSRSGSSTKMFVNGTQTGSTYTDSTNYTNTAGRPVIGADGFNLVANFFNGYIDDLRITKGVARYTSNFIPPAAQLPAR